MISVSEAIQQVDQHILPSSKTRTLTVVDALGSILAERVRSPLDMPSFRQSSMDGYAVRIHTEKSYRLVGEVQAGSPQNPKLKTGEAVRIFTGAPVPDDADAIVIQEKVQRTDDHIIVEHQPQQGHYIREVGEQIKTGDLALEKGTRLTPAGIGFLTALGLETVTVYQQPKIAIVVTGNELRAPGTPLERGEIYESNTAMLMAALQQDGFSDVSVHQVSDDFDATRKCFADLLVNCDVLLVSGGISVGDYDFVGKALAENDVNEIFYKVKQKPGKPLFFGKQKDKIVFALPGNPASALSCFYVYVLPGLRKWVGRQDIQLERKQSSLTAPFVSKSDRAQFLKAFAKADTVTILDGQASSMIHSFALANALVYVPEDTGALETGILVETLILP